jgi:hypothetical protein
MGTSVSRELVDPSLREGRPVVSTSLAAFFACGWFESSCPDRFLSKQHSLPSPPSESSVSSNNSIALSAFIVSTFKHVLPQRFELDIFILRDLDSNGKLVRHVTCRGCRLATARALGASMPAGCRRRHSNETRCVQRVSCAGGISRCCSEQSFLLSCGMRRIVQSIKCRMSWLCDAERIWSLWRDIRIEISNFICPSTHRRSPLAAQERVPYNGIFQRLWIPSQHLNHHSNVASRCHHSLTLLP